MIKKILTYSYTKLVHVIKKTDRMTGYKIGHIVRKITNVNTRRYWDKKLASYGQTWRDFPYNHILEFLPKDSHFSLLDIGCALGDGCVLLKTHFPRAEISGADFSKIGIEKAKKKSSQIHFFVLDISKENPPRKYDYITLVSTLEHFNNPYPVIDKCLKFVNGAIIVAVPHTERFDDPHLYRRSQHRYLFNENTFSKYNCAILGITEQMRPGLYRYIIYELKPR